jgi:(4S)-4-hydroxy-5-phosphonooxypentane-2,3-dione isomerase
MIVTTVKVYVKKQYIDDFIKATLENHQHSIKEDGNLRFDVLQCCEDETCFTLYEAYASKEAAAQHKETNHYLNWRDKVAPWMEKPREGVPHKVIAPTDKNLW